MKGLSLFSGIGGGDLAAEWAGIEPVAFCEQDLFCQKILKKHWPDVPIFDDVRNIRGDQFGDIDIVYGGFPCQDVSLAGKRTGFRDSDGEVTRSGLWGEMFRIVREAKPRWVVAENVRGLLSIPSWNGRRGGGLEVFSETWPNWGIVLDGVAIEPMMLEQFTGAREFLLLPTPIACDSYGGASKVERIPTGWRRRSKKGVTYGAKLRSVFWTVFGTLKPQPKIYETIMGFPIGWTELESSETP